jgi:hypothetical protein
MNRDVRDSLDAAPANAVVYSAKAWAAARKGASADLWFPDCGAWSSGAISSDQMVTWVEDWELLQPARSEAVAS